MVKGNVIRKKRRKTGRARKFKYQISKPILVFVLRVRLRYLALANPDLFAHIFGFCLLLIRKSDSVAPTVGRLTAH